MANRRTSISCETGEVLDFETGEVLDFEVMSKHFSKCKLHKSKLSPEEFEECFQVHKNSDKCQINFEWCSQEVWNKMLWSLF